MCLVSHRRGEDTVATARRAQFIKESVWTEFGPCLKETFIQKCISFAHPHGSYEYFYCSVPLNKSTAVAKSNAQF